MSAALLRREDRAPAPRFEDVVADLMPFMDTRLRLEIRLCLARLSVRELLDLEAGSLVDVLCKERVLMRGELTVLEDTLGLRITEIVDAERRV